MVDSLVFSARRLRVALDASSRRSSLTRWATRLALLAAAGFTGCGGTSAAFGDGPDVVDGGSQAFFFGEPSSGGSSASNTGASSSSSASMPRGGASPWAATS